MRTLLTGERATLSGARYGIFAKLEVMNASGTWKDLTALSSIDWLDSLELSTDVDQPTWSATFALKRAVGALSLAPLMSASALNVNNVGAYAPLLNAGSRVRLSTAFTAGGAPAGGDYRSIFEGIVDIVAWEKDPVTLQCRDLGAILLDTFIETERSYANPLGTAMETVLQSILDDNLASPPALYTPTSPGTMLTMLDPLPATTSVMEAIRSIALQIGWDVRYKWSGSAFLLTLYQPNRSTASAVTSFAPTEYFDLPGVAMDKSGIRNVVNLSITDGVTGVRVPITVTDPTSIATFGRLPILIDESATSQIDSSAEGTALATAILSDLSSPKVQQVMETSYFWPAELGDVYDFVTNGVHYDQTQRAGVVAISHQLSGTGKGRTTLRTRAKPIGSYAAWLQRSTPGLGGNVAGLPEFLFVNAPVPVTSAGVIIGWKVSGRVDTDTNAVIIALSASLAIRATSPDNVLGDAPEDDVYWLNTAPGGFFTIEVYLLQGGSGQVTLTPASLYNPTAAIPPARGGTLGGVFVQTLSRTPVTSINTVQPTATTFGVTLSVRPLTATIKYRFAPTALVGTEPWVAVTGPQGATTFLVDVSAAPVMLEYYGVSTDNVAEEVHSMRLDQGTSADIVSVFAAETAPNLLTASFILTDDVVNWKLYARLGDYPDRPSMFADPFDTWLKFTGNRQKTEVSFYAVENAGVPWYIEVHGYDLYGNPGREETFALFIDGPAWGTTTPGAITGLVANIVNEGSYFIDLTWANNAIIEAAASSRFTVSIRENGVAVATLRQAKLDHLGTNTIAGFGGWHRACTPAAVGAAGAAFFTFDYEVDLWDSSVFVATSSTSISGWFTVASGGVAPTATPPTPVVTAGYPSSVALQADWAAVLPAYEIEIDWHASTDAFASDDDVFMSEILLPGTRTHTARGFVTGQSGRCRIRYANAFGNGPWSPYSNVLGSGGPPLP